VPPDRSVADVSQRSIAVFDIDGVVADVRHRLHHLDQRPKNWDAFFNAAAADPPLATGIELVRELAERHKIVWLTGRPEWLRPTTEAWLSQHELTSESLQMRPNRDHRPATAYKLNALRQLTSTESPISAFIDDDEDVVNAALAAGLPAILADWVPRSPQLRTAQHRLGRT
jgi:phosphoglycolate phosphatase-like HAD superfamily hydrolase